MFKKIFKFNRVILTMVFVEFFMNGAFGTISPFFAIFIVEGIKGGSASVAGFAAAIYWIVKSIFQLPIARWLDKTDGEMDDFWALFWGYLLSAMTPVVYFFSTQPSHIYLAQALLGFSMAWAMPAWYSIFTRHLDKFRISFEWSLYSVFSVGIAAALAAAGGGVLIDQFGFRIIFLIASIIIIFSAFSLLTMKKYISKKPESLEKVVPEKKKKIYGH